MFKFAFPTYSEVKEFWTGFYSNVNKFWNDWSDDVKQSLKK